MDKQISDIRSEYAEKYGFSVPDKSVHKAEPGLSERVLREMSEIKGEKGEHEWIHKFRLRALDHFMKRPMPKWGGDLSSINFDDITYYIKPTEKQEESWDELPPEIKNTFDKLGIPEAERKFLAGVGVQFDSENVYHSLKKDLEKKGVIFVDPDTGLQKYPHIFKKWFGSTVPPEDNKFAALNSAFFSGGSFIYIPPGVEVKQPLQAYFRINAEGFGQFERTLIIVDEGAKAHYIEGCLPVGEEVSKGEEISPIEKIEKGMTVINSLGEETEVEKTMTRSYEGDLIEIRPVSAASKFQLTPEHPVLCIKRSKVIISKRQNRKLSDVNNEKLLSEKPEFVEAGNLEEGDFLIFPINKVVKDDEKVSHDLLALLGYYLAEGHVGKINGCDAVVLSFNMKERKIIEHTKNLIKKLIGKTPSEFTEVNKNSTRLTVYSKELVDICLKYCGKYSDKKKLHKIIMELPHEKQKTLIETYYKGDGSISLGKPIRVRAGTISRQLAFQMQELLSRQGIYACINERDAFDEKTKDGRVIHHKKRYVIFHALDKRSHKVKLKGKDYFLVPIKKINKLHYKGYVYNFRVSREPNTYLVKGFAVHNCTAPIYSKESLHAAVVEVIALPGSHFRYTTLQNWSNNVYNLVTKRAHAFEGATVEWLDANIGSRCTMKYPSVFLRGPRAKADILSVAFAGKGQHQDTGGKVVHLAPHTTSKLIAKSVSKDGGRTTYRGLLHVSKLADNVKSTVRCDALLLDEISKTDTYPYNEVNNESATITHEATVGKIGEQQLFYLMSRGLSEQEALSMIVSGFFDAFAKEIPLEYAVEFNRLIQLEMTGAVG